MEVEVTNVTVTAIGTLCNTLLILAIIVDPLGILRKGAWVTILNLAAADFLVCANAFCVRFLLMTEAPQVLNLPKQMMDGHIFFEMFGMTASFMFLTLLTVQVYMIIKYPIKSRLILTKMKVVLASLVVWVLAMLFGLSKIAYVWFKKNVLLYLRIADFICLVLVVVIQSVVKVLIVVEILRSRRDAVNAETRNKKKKDLAKTVIILCVILIVAAFPYFLARQISYFYHGVDDTIPKNLFSYYYEPVFHLNFVANPILYSLRLKDYRRSLLALFSCKCRKRHINIQSGPQQPMIEMLNR